MPTLIELTAQIVAQHAKKTVMTQEQLLQDMHLIHTALQIMESSNLLEQPGQAAIKTTSRPAKNFFIYTLRSEIPVSHFSCDVHSALSR